MISNLRQNCLFLQLFFSDEVLVQLAIFTNNYAAIHILEKQYYALPDGSWDPVDREDIKKLIAFLIHAGLVSVLDIENYWSTASLYNGLWGRSFFSPDRFKAIISFFHLEDPAKDAGDRLYKIRYLYDVILSASKKFYQPKQHVSIDERMIRFKGRHGMKVMSRIN